MLLPTALRTTALRSLAPTALACLAAVPAHAQLEESYETTLYVLSPGGNLYTTHVDGGAFQLVASVGLPMVSVVQHGTDLLLGADNGSVLRFDMQTGATAWAYFLPSDLNSLAVRGDDLFVGAASGLLQRYHVQTGALQEITPLGIGIEALAIDEDELYVGTQDGTVFVDQIGVAGPLATFSSTRNGLSSMGQTNSALYVGQESGLVRIFDKQTEVLTYAYPVQSDVTAMVRDADHFLIGGSDGVIHRAASFGAVLTSTQAPEPVQALWLPQPVGQLEPEQDFQQVAAGIAVDFTLNAGPEHAGDYHFLLGSFAGNTPGMIVQEHQFPLNADVYLQACLDNCLGGALQGCFGTFDGSGRATVSLQVPGPLSPALVGLELRHAYFILDAFDPTQVVGVSQANDLYFQ